MTTTTIETARTDYDETNAAYKATMVAYKGDRTKAATAARKAAREALEDARAAYHAAKENSSQPAEPQTEAPEEQTTATTEDVHTTHPNYDRAAEDLRNLMPYLETYTRERYTLGATAHAARGATRRQAEKDGQTISEAFQTTDRAEAIAPLLRRAATYSDRKLAETIALYDGHAAIHHASHAYTNAYDAELNAAIHRHEDQRRNQDPYHAATERLDGHHNTALAYPGSKSAQEDRAEAQADYERHHAAREEERRPLIRKAARQAYKQAIDAGLSDGQADADAYRAAVHAGADYPDADDAARDAERHYYAHHLSDDQSAIVQEAYAAYVRRRRNGEPYTRAVSAAWDKLRHDHDAGQINDTQRGHNRAALQYAIDHAPAQELEPTSAQPEQQQEQAEAAPEEQTIAEQLSETPYQTIAALYHTILSETHNTYDETIEAAAELGREEHPTLTPADAYAHALNAHTRHKTLGCTDYDRDPAYGQECESAEDQQARDDRARKDRAIDAASEAYINTKHDGQRDATAYAKAYDAAYQVSKDPEQAEEAAQEARSHYNAVDAEIAADTADEAQQDSTEEQTTMPTYYTPTTADTTYYSEDLVKTKMAQAIDAAAAYNAARANGSTHSDAHHAAYHAAYQHDRIEDNAADAANAASEAYTRQQVQREAARAARIQRLANEAYNTAADADPRNPSAAWMAAYKATAPEKANNEEGYKAAEAARDAYNAAHPVTPEDAATAIDQALQAWWDNSDDHGTPDRLAGTEETGTPGQRTIHTSNGERFTLTITPYQDPTPADEERRRQTIAIEHPAQQDAIENYQYYRDQRGHDRDRAHETVYNNLRRNHDHDTASALTINAEEAYDAAQDDLESAAEKAYAETYEQTGSAREAYSAAEQEALTHTSNYDRARAAAVRAENRAG